MMVDAPIRAPGERIGPYVLVRRLGAGSAGEVWEALVHGPADFRKRIALKLLRLHDPEQGRALAREARMGALLQHPNVVGTLQLGDHDGTWCIALELVRGPSVDALCRRSGGSLPPRVVLEIGVQAAAGLHHVHTFDASEGVAGLVHRDVKSANLLVDRTGLVKLADLGISLAQGEAHRAVAGTPGYMAPEQAAGRPEPRSDLFSLGVVLYRIATGRAPFGRGEPAIEAVKGVEGFLACPSFLAPLERTVPGLGSVVRWCLRHDPADRPASARVLGDALAALRHGQAAGPSLLEILARAAPELGLDPDATPVADAPTRVLPVGNLRPARDRFVGRGAELDALEALVTDARWVVVIGPGGIGKTRLAVEAARRLRDRLPGGAWVFDLSGARSAEGICAAVAAPLAVELDRADPIGQLGRVFHAKGRAVVVLDNLEQVVPALPATVGAWLEAAPEATFVGTSRVVPGLAGERTYPLDELGIEDAVALFHARAPRQVAEAELGEVEPLCRALEGVPLSIELAAARLRAMPVGQIRTRLSLALLAGGGGERPERHRSVRASLRWSCDLLGPAARSALAQLSVFEGSFDPRAAEAVLDLAAIPEAPWALDVLQELVEASLVRVDAPRGRFRMAVAVREFADAVLLAPADRGPAVARHGAYHAQLGTREALDALDGPGGAERYRLLQQELDDVVAACRRAIARGAGDVAAATLRAAHAVFERQGDAESWAALTREVLGMPSLAPVDRAHTEHRAGWALHEAGRTTEALAHLERAMAVYRTLGERRAEAMVLGSLAAVHVEQGRLEVCEDELREALGIQCALGNRRGEAIALGNLANIATRRGRPEEARAQYERALALHREVGNRRFEASTLGNLGVTLLRLGRPDEARRNYLEALRVHREVGNRRYEASVLMNLGRLHGVDGRPAEALACYEEALATFRELGTRRPEAGVLGNVGTLHHALGDGERARVYLQRALAVHQEVGNRSFVGKAECALGELDGDEGRPAEAMARYERALAIAREVGEPADEGIALHHIAELLAKQGRPEEARAHVERALAIHRAVANPTEEVVASVVLGTLDLADGRPGDAEARFDTAAQRFRALGEVRAEAKVLVHLGEAHRVQGRTEQARACLDRALVLLRGFGARRDEGVALLHLARIAAGVDGAAAALALLDGAEALLRATRTPAELGWALTLRAELLDATGDVAACRAALDEAAGVAPWHAGLREEVERVRARLGQDGGPTSGSSQLA